MIKIQNHIPVLALIFFSIATIGNAATSSANEISPADCPVQLDSKFVEKKSRQSCVKHTASDNKSHYYLSSWVSKEESLFSSIYYQPIGGYQYWKKRPKIEKKHVKNWTIFEKVELSDITEISCKDHTCFSFKMPDDFAECLWFDRNLNKTGRLSGHGNKNGVLRGFLCRSKTGDLYTSDEAMKFLTSISAK
ncbi:hypothetical protein [Kiloniella sp.]|uniref:hypothetical protein n=1 Tax=Kiloniella sp. TaxID=1938587 RepID=UPI003A93B919